MKHKKARSEFDELFGDEEHTSYIKELAKYERLHVPEAVKQARFYILAGIKWMDPRTRYVLNRGLSLLFTRLQMRKICSSRLNDAKAISECVVKYTEAVTGLSSSEQYMLLSKVNYMIYNLYMLSPNSNEIMKLGLKWLLTKGEQEIRYEYHSYIPSTKYARIFSGRGGEE